MGLARHMWLVQVYFESRSCRHEVWILHPTAASVAKLWQASVVLEQCSNCCGLGSTCNISQQALSVGQLDVQSGGGTEQDGGGWMPTEPAACAQDRGRRDAYWTCCLCLLVQDRGRRSSPTNVLFLESSQWEFHTATPCLSLMGFIRANWWTSRVLFNDSIHWHKFRRVQPGWKCGLQMRELDKIHLTDLVQDEWWLDSASSFMMTIKTALVS